ncbi:hypothetical protein C8R43DRAFT_897268, partial [Mycena crocata]
MDALDIDIELKREMPIWYHIGANTRMNNSIASKCLRNNHKIRTIGDVIDFINREDQSRPHYQRINCACWLCKADRDCGCRKPSSCQEQAIKLLNDIFPKWDPRRIIRQSNPPLDHDQQAENISAFESKKPVIFDPNVTVNDSLSSTFRAF